MENIEQKIKLDEANREKNTVKERFETLKVEKNHLDEQLKSNEDIRDNLEGDIKRARAHSEELTSQLTKITLEKESCQDELHHMRTEVRIFDRELLFLLRLAFRQILICAKSFLISEFSHLR